MFLWFLERRGSQNQDFEIPLCNPKSSGS